MCGLEEGFRVWRERERSREGEGEGKNAEEEGFFER